MLDKLGLKALPFSAANITDDVQYVIYSSAYNPEKNPDLIEAKRRTIPMKLYGIDNGNYDFADLKIDTSCNVPDEIVQKVLDELVKRNLIEKAE